MKGSTVPIETMHTRGNGTRYPNEAADSAVLREMSDERPGLHPYERTLGDLVADVLAGRALEKYNDEGPEPWESVEHALLVQTGRELRAFTLALRFFDRCTIETLDAELDKDELVDLTGIAHRVASGAELCRRLRMARWGHPNFGGGEASVGPTQSAAGGAS